MKIAIIGTGISGLGAAWLLHRNHDIHIFERNDYIGGHANTIRSPSNPPFHPDIDTGFIVYNEETYPNFIALLDHIHVERTKTDMSFAVSMDGGRMEYSGDHLFAQKSNLIRPQFHRMWMDILRFYRQAPHILDQDYQGSLNEYLRDNHYSDIFINAHILPMAAAIWSTGSETVGDFPAQSFVRFFINHGLFRLINRPQWWTIQGGSQKYVEALSRPFRSSIRLNAPVKSITRHKDHVLVDGEKFDHVILACHSDQSLDLLSDASKDETSILSSFPYAPNIAYLHSDETFMPRRKKTWSSWNYLSHADNGDTNKLCLTYWMNKLQPFIGTDQNYFVTLNPPAPPAADKTHKIINYAHPQFTDAARRSWGNIGTIQGINRTWFCGAWCGYGFHEDGLTSGLTIAESLDPSCRRPWSIQEKSPAAKHCMPPHGTASQTTEGPC